MIEIDIHEISPNKSQPRKTFNPDTIETLAESIKKHGIIQPIIVRKKEFYYEIIAGERRWRAAKEAGLTKVPVIVRNTSDRRVAELALVENIQREDLNAIEEALSFKSLMDEYGLKQEEIAQIIGKSRSYVANITRLLKLDEKVQDLRYGENPHQKAGFYKKSFAGYSIGNAEQLHGKELSYNNIQDANAALEILKEFEESTVVAVKHMNPCGVGSGKTIKEAWDKAYEADKTSIFGGIVATNSCVTTEVAKELSQLFLEIVIAPSYEKEALEIITQKKNIRVLQLDMSKEIVNKMKITSVMDGILIQEFDEMKISESELICVTEKKPTDDEIKDLLFNWNVVKHVKSNAIVIGKDGQTIGIGAGQMNRVGAAKIALEQGGDKCKGAVLASDAFFPMADTVELAAKYGIKAIIQPGGSIKDSLSVEACNKYGIAMVFTGVRHFKH